MAQWEKKAYEWRRRIVIQVREGSGLRAVARANRVSLTTVQRWVKRAANHPLDEVEWGNLSHAPRRSNRTAPLIEEKVLHYRKSLKEYSPLGECGAQAIRRELLAHGMGAAPSIRTIGRILERRGALDGARRIRRPPPPSGWYLPDVMNRRAELDSFDVIEDHVLEGGRMVQVMTGISLHGGVPGAWPYTSMTADRVMESLVMHWKDIGLPTYAQFDNAPLFIGVMGYRDVFGRMVRFCMGLGVVPVFTPFRETGFQASIESFNGRWGVKVWNRFFHTSMSDVRYRSARYISAYRQRIAVRAESAPPRKPFPQGWTMNLRSFNSGRVIFLRRTDRKGSVQVMGRKVLVDEHWPHRLVRCEVSLQHHRISFYSLRRMQPLAQPLLRAIPYHPAIRDL